METAGWIGLACIFGGGIFLARSLIKCTEEEAPKELEDIRKALKKGRRVEVSLEKIGHYAWLRDLGSREDSSLPVDNLEMSSETEDRIKNEKISQYYRELSEKSKAFLNDVVLPICEALERDKSLESVLKVLVLLSKKGNIPSVIGEVSLKEPVQYRMLKKITLEEHSLNVATKGMKIVREELPYMLDISPGKYLLIFLGHDLGKIYAHEEGYVTGDHPVISAKILNEIIPDDLDWKASVLQIVKSHHMDGVPFEKDSPEAFDLEILKRADRLAREEEIRDFEAVYGDSTIGEKETEKSGEEERRPKEDTEIDETASRAVGVPNTETVPLLSKEISKEWFMPVGVTPAELFTCIRPWVNRVVTAEALSDPASPVPPDTPEGNFLAVSQPDGIVYVRPDLIYYGFMRVVSRKKKERENATLIALPKNEALKHIVAWLMKYGCVIPGHVKEGYIGRWYAFKLGDKEHTSLFTPIPAEAFGVLPSEFEKERKTAPKVCDVHGFKKVNRSAGGAK